MDRARARNILVPMTHPVAYRFGAMQLHPGRQLLRGGSPVPLGSIALELLHLLVRARGEVVTKDELFARLWPDVVVVENTLHQHIRALREALGDQSELIATVSRRGYRFGGAVQEFSVESAAAVSAVPGAAPALPTPLTPLIGREAELAAIEQLLQSHRCVTLLGPGGVGKTRLVLEIARRHSYSRGEGVYLAALAAVTAGDGMAAAIAASIGLSGPSGMPALVRIRHALRESAALLVVDNCEHLIDEAAAVVLDLLQHGPKLRVLATSQRPLRISGEQRYQVPGFGLPPPAASERSVLMASPAVRLLLARVGECDSRLAFDDAALKNAAELCRQLDGNALAIELAAVHVATLGLDASCAGLIDRFQLPAPGSRDALAKHRSLKAMLDWSHELLSAEQQATFRRVSVFAGGWTLESAGEVLSDANDHPADIAAGLAELVECSLVACEPSTRSPRFRMLETQHAYARDKLHASGERAHYTSAHARQVCRLFEASYAEWDCTPDGQWLARYAPERDNLRLAIRTAIEGPDPALAASLLGSSVWLWRATGATHEFKQILENAAQRSQTPLPRESAARMMLAQAYTLHATSTDSHRIKAAAERAVEAFGHATEDAIGAANAGLCLASAFAQLGDTASHRACLARVDAVLAGQPSGKTFGWYCGSHAWAAQLAGEPREALEWALRSRAAYRRSGGWHGETRAMLHIADLKLTIGDLEGAISAGNESVDRLQGDLHRDDLGRALANLGAAWFAHGDPDVARDCWARALNELRGLDFTYWVFDHVALLAIAEGRHECAAQLIGYADAGYARLQKGRRVQNEQRCRTLAQAQLDARYRSEDLATMMLAGAVASEDEMIAAALLGRGRIEKGGIVVA